MSRKKWSQPLMWGMIIAILNPLGVSYIALIGVAIGNTLTFVWCAMLAWAIYFYAIYLLCTRPHDSRLVQIYLLLMGTLMLPWGLVLLITCIMNEIKANKPRSPSSRRDKRRLTMRTQPFSLLAVHAILCGL
jgi:uncharacterized membrane protein